MATDTADPRRVNPAAGDDAPTDPLRLIGDTLEEAGIYVAVARDGDAIVLSGEVESQENRQAAIDVAEAVAGPYGLRVDDAMEVLDFSPEDAFAGEDAVGTVTDLRPLVHRQEAPPETLEPDFTGDVGTTDAMRSAAEAEPYFPPTDPVVRPIEGPEELEIVGGFSETSMDDLADAVGYERRDDDEIGRDVLRELREDALTTDLVVHVNVRDGVVTLRGEVPSLEDAENAEAVAARIGGVVEVREELTIAGR